ncbi:MULTISPECIES: cysteine peptidase family C39 domain-containing protein, partial [Parabacteroides]
MFKPFPTYRQLDSMDCGPTCLRMIARFYGRVYSIQNLREKAF